MEEVKKTFGKWLEWLEMTNGDLEFVDMVNVDKNFWYREDLKHEDQVYDETVYTLKIPTSTPKSDWIAEFYGIAVHDRLWFLLDGLEIGYGDS